MIGCFFLGVRIIHNYIIKDFENLETYCSVAVIYSDIDQVSVVEFVSVNETFQLLIFRIIMA